MCSLPLKKPTSHSNVYSFCFERCTLSLGKPSRLKGALTVSDRNPACLLTWNLYLQEIFLFERTLYYTVKGTTYSSLEKDNWTLYMKRPKQNCNFKEQLFKHENCIFERTLLLQMHSIHSSLNTVFWKKWSMSVNVFFKNCVSWEEYRACQRTPPYVV